MSLLAHKMVELVFFWQRTQLQLMINTSLLPPQLINTNVDITWLEHIELTFILHMNGAMGMNNNSHVFPIK